MTSIPPPPPPPAPPPAGADDAGRWSPSWGQAHPLGLPPPPADARPIPAPFVVVDQVSKWFGDVVAVSEVSLPVGPASPRCSAPTAPASRRLLRMLCGLTPPSRARSASSARDPRTDLGGTRPHRAGAPAGDHVRGAAPPSSSCASPAVLHGVRRPDAAAVAALQRGRARPRRPAHHLQLLQGHAPAGEGGAGPGARARRAGARRAAHRPRPPPATAPDRPVPAARRRGALRGGVEPRARRGRALRLAGAGDGAGAPRRRRRLPRHPRAHGRPPAPAPHHAPTGPVPSPAACSRSGAVIGACASPSDRPRCSSTPTTSPRFRRTVAEVAPEHVGAACARSSPLDDDLDSVFRYLVGR